MSQCNPHGPEANPWVLPATESTFHTNKQAHSQAQWLIPVILASWEDRDASTAQAKNYREPISVNKSQMWWYMPVIAATQES
jgi:hypothetical protein